MKKRNTILLFMIFLVSCSLDSEEFTSTQQSNDFLLDYSTICFELGSKTNCYSEYTSQAIRNFRDCCLGLINCNYMKYDEYCLIPNNTIAQFNTHVKLIREYCSSRDFNLETLRNYVRKNNLKSKFSEFDVNNSCVVEIKSEELY